MHILTAALLLGGLNLVTRLGVCSEVMRMRSWRALIGLLAAVVVGVAVPSLASASNHEIKIREVYAGSAALPNSEYVELQMYAPGQNLFHLGTSVKLYDASGAVTETFVPSGSAANDPPHSANQQRVLFANSGAQTQFGVSAGYTLPVANAISDAGGAACYTSTEAGSFIDCVSWGTFTGTRLPSATGGDADFPGGIADSKAISRSITAGCSTMLEASDDTNKPADWGDVSPNPLNNAATPARAGVPVHDDHQEAEGQDDRQDPDLQVQGERQPHSSFQCKVDKGQFASCTSPFTTKKLAKGKHTFQVRRSTADGGQGKAAKATFKVVKKKPHHH